MRRYLAIATFLAAALLSLPTAHADVTYTMTVTGDPVTGSWSWAFTEPTFFTGKAIVSAADLSAVTNPAGCSISGVEIQPHTTTLFTAGPMFSPDCNGFPSEFFGFTDGPLDHLGTYIVFHNPQNTLVVSGTPSTTPEPSSLILLGTGALGLLGPIRRELFPHSK